MMTLISFSPLRIPFRRRIETFAILIWVYIFFFGLVTGIVVWLLLLLSSFWPIAILYATLVLMFDRNVSSQGGRRISFIRNSCVWKYCCQYFPLNLVKTSNLDKSKNYLFGVHPHGIISAGAFGNFSTEGNDFSKLFPGIKTYLLIMKLFFQFPFSRDILLSYGLCDVSRKSIRHILTDEKGGNAAIIVVGGAAESLDAHPGSCILTLKNRKGFIREALTTGAQLVPVYSFGENNIYNQVNNPRGSFLRGLQDRIRRWLNFAPVLFYGRGIFQYSFGFLPFRRKITTVIGAPICVVKRTNPSKSEIDLLHSLYMKKLKELFDLHKKEHSEYPDGTLEII